VRFRADLRLAVRVGKRRSYHPCDFGIALWANLPKINSSPFQFIPNIETGLFIDAFKQTTCFCYPFLFINGPKYLQGINGLLKAFSEITRIAIFYRIFEQGIPALDLLRHFKIVHFKTLVLDGLKEVLPDSAKRTLGGF